MHGTGDPRIGNGADEYRQLFLFTDTDSICGDEIMVSLCLIVCCNDDIVKSGRYLDFRNSSASICVFFSS